MVEIPILAGRRFYLYFCSEFHHFNPPNWDSNESDVGFFLSISCLVRIDLSFISMAGFLEPDWHDDYISLEESGRFGQIDDFWGFFCFGSVWFTSHCFEGVGADSLAGSALKPVSRAIQRLIQPVQGLYQNMKKQGWGAVNAAQGIRGGGAGGRMLGWMGNQIASRTQNAWSSARGARDPEISDSQPIRPSSPNFRANAAIRGFIFNRDQSVPSEEKSNIGMRLARGFKHQRLSASKAIKL